MAKKYTDSDVARLATQNYASLTKYEQRLVRGYNRGLSRSQSRGHARTTKGEKKVSTITGTRGQRATTPKEPKIKKQVVHLPGKAKMITTYSTTKAVSSIQSHVNTGTPQRRVYFQVWDKDRGAFIDVYKGRRSKAHGITIEEFLRRIDDKLSTGQASDMEDAFRQVISEDSEEAADYGNGQGTAPYTFTQVRVYVLPTA